MSWISWEKIAKPKKKERLGFKDITFFNDALLAKVGWRIIKNPSCMLACCLLGKYCQSELFLTCKAPSSASHDWRSVLVGRDLFTLQLDWMVGTGERISIWDDPWLSHSEQLRPVGPTTEETRLLKVSDLVLTGTTEWDEEKLESILPFHKEQILKIRPSKLKAIDDLVWLKKSSGEYSTRSGYLSLMEEKERLATPSTNTNATAEWLPNVWNIKTAEKIKLFLWKSLHGALPVGEQFAIRNIPVSPRCIRCNEIETVSHLLFSCPFAVKVWSLAPLAHPVTSTSFLTTRDGWETLRKLPTLPPVGLGPRTLASWIVWSLWTSRNQLIFEKRTYTAEETIQKALREAREWMTA